MTSPVRIRMIRRDVCIQDFRAYTPRRDEERCEGNLDWNPYGENGQGFFRSEENSVDEHGGPCGQEEGPNRIQQGHVGQILRQTIYSYIIAYRSTLKQATDSDFKRCRGCR